MHQNFPAMEGSWQDRRDSERDPQESQGFAQKQEHESPRGTYTSRSAFKLTRASPYTHRNSGSGTKRNIKEVRVKLDFCSKGSDRKDVPLSTAETRCSVDERYISKRFVLNKINLTDMRQEIEKINKVDPDSHS